MLLRDLGYRLFIVSNQAGVVRGLFTEEDAQNCNAALGRLLAEQGVVLAGVYYCPHHPTHGVGAYRQESEDRKPRPGMLLCAVREHEIDLTTSYMIGDKKSDILAGQAAGCRTILVLTGEAGRGEPDLHAQPDWAVDNLLEAARVIERGVLVKNLG